MNCPYYQDLTRTCIQSFPRVLLNTDFSVCESDAHSNCFAYVALQAPFHCKYERQCIEDLIQNQPLLSKLFIEDNRAIQLIKQMTSKYCFSEKRHKDCACFRLLEQGIRPPVELLPDGSKFRLRDLLLKKEITLE